MRTIVIRFFLLNYLNFTICIMAVRITQSTNIRGFAERLSLSTIIHRLYFMSVFYTFPIMIAFVLFLMHT
jgi:hypothetical protein